MPYGCQKCGSPSSTVELRRVVINAGPNKELQIAGIIPVSRCLNEKCNAMSAACNLNVGDLAGLQATRPATPAGQPPAEVAAAKVAQLLEMRQKISELEAEVIEPPLNGAGESQKVVPPTAIEATPAPASPPAPPASPPAEPVSDPATVAPKDAPKH